VFGPSNCLRHHTASIGSIAMPIENELAPMAPRIEPTEKGRAHASQVEKACGLGAKRVTTVIRNIPTPGARCAAGSSR